MQRGRELNRANDDAGTVGSGAGVREHDKTFSGNYDAEFDLPKWVDVENARIEALKPYAKSLGLNIAGIGLKWYSKNGSPLPLFADIQAQSLLCEGDGWKRPSLPKVTSAEELKSQLMLFASLDPLSRSDFLLGLNRGAPR